MDRLTFDGNFCDIAMCRENPCQYDGACTQRQVWERLKAYEETGLEPEQAVYAKLALMGKVIAEVKEFDGIPIDHLRELAKAEKDGRLWMLPCKVGQTVYVIGESCDFCETYLDEPERCMICEKGHYVEERVFELWMFSELNESIFLTREEAEAALKGGNDT